MFGKSILVSPVTKAMYIKPVVNGRDTIQAEDFSVRLNQKKLTCPLAPDWYRFLDRRKIFRGK